MPNVTTLPVTPRPTPCARPFTLALLGVTFLAERENTPAFGVEVAERDVHLWCGRTHFAVGAEWLRFRRRTAI